MSEHDPFNESELAHPRARELMSEELFFDCTDEDAPFGSDEGSDAYFEWREWRKENKSNSLTDCFEWILDGNLSGYNENLCTEVQIKIDQTNPDNAFLAEHYDIYTLDTTIIATALGQLLDEGIIDKDAKPYIMVALNRQMNSNILDAIVRVVNAA